jgi:hypothetical protein
MPKHLIPILLTADNAQWQSFACAMKAGGHPAQNARSLFLGKFGAEVHHH